MAQTVLWGTDASISTLSGSGALFNVFGVSVVQGTAEACGFGDTWMRRNGTVKSASATVGGFTTYGAANNAPGISSMTRAGGTLTCTFLTGCTLAFTAIPDGLGLNVVFTANQTSSYSYSSNGPVTETWIIS